MRTLRETTLFLPLSLVAAYVVLMVFERIGMGSTRGWLYQLVLLGYVAVFVTGHPKTLPHRVLAILGGVFCLIGDLFLGHAFDALIDDGMRMPLGMAGFFVGHLLWFASFWLYRDPFPRRRFLVTLAIVYAIEIVLWAAFVNTPDQPLLSPLALVYCLALGAPLAFGIAHLPVSRWWTLVVVAYATFFVSDFLIALKDIRGVPIPDWIYGDAVWLTYLVALCAVAFFLVRYRRDVPDGVRA